MLLQDSPESNPDEDESRDEEEDVEEREGELEAGDTAAALVVAGVHISAAAL